MAAGFGSNGGFDDSGVFNLEHGPDEPVLLGVKPNFSLYAFIRVRVNPDGGLTAIADELPLAHPLISSDLTLWGVPADSNPANVARDWPRVPFMTGMTECGVRPTTTMRAYSYEGKVKTVSDTIDDPTFGCDRVPFQPTLTAQPTSRAAAAPTGLAVQIRVPQHRLPDGVATAHARSVRIVLPEGMTVSPSAANGLEACTPGQFGYRTVSAVSCPDSSKIGTITIRTPLLSDSMQGSVYLAKQNDNPFNSLLALYIQAEGSGVQIKLAGRVDPDPVTGRLTTTFDDNPQLPFDQLDLEFKSGPRAPLTNPQTCGTYHSETAITSWAGQSVAATTPLVINQACQPVGFSPTVRAGSMNAVGGASSTFSLTFARGDHDQELRDITVDMPTGLTGKIANADLCPEGLANAGTCGEGSRIGSMTTSAGPGTTPFFLPGRAYLTGPYKGAPFGLSIVVPAVAGPFDLGHGRRARVDLRRRERRLAESRLRPAAADPPGDPAADPLGQRGSRQARLHDQSDQLPGKGASSARITSQMGMASDVSSRFQVGDCARLPIRPKMTLQVGARGRTERTSARRCR